MKNTSYDDILYHPHVLSPRHVPMSISDRAAQFSPFAALTGYESAVKETARLTQTAAELSEDALTVLDRAMQRVRCSVGSGTQFTFTYFIPDSQKQGGRYMSRTAAVQKINLADNTLTLQDGIILSISAILSIEEAIK